MDLTAQAAVSLTTEAGGLEVQSQSWQLSVTLSQEKTEKRPEDIAQCGRTLGMYKTLGSIFSI